MEKKKKLKKKWLPGLFDFLNYKGNNPTVLKFMFYPPGMRFGMKMLARMFKAANLPLVNRIHPWVRNDKNRLFVIPVETTLERGEDVTLPYQIAEDFINRSSYRVIMNFCPCRKAGECKTYPVELGCILLGEDTRHIPKACLREATKEEAIKHLHWGIEQGLPCFVGKPRIDNHIFGVPDNSRMFSICFCCECCCLGSTIVRYLPPEKRNVQYNRLEGLEVWVDEEKCVGCGICADKCWLGLITISDGKAHIPDDCRGCGRCAKYCPNDAIHLKLNNPAFMEHAIKQLSEMIEVEED